MWSCASPTQFIFVCSFCACTNPEKEQKKEKKNQEKPAQREQQIFFNKIAFFQGIYWSCSGALEQWKTGSGGSFAHILRRLFTVSNGPDKWQPAQPTPQTRCCSIWSWWFHCEDVGMQIIAATEILLCQYYVHNVVCHLVSSFDNSALDSELATPTKAQKTTLMSHAPRCMHRNGNHKFHSLSPSSWILMRPAIDMSGCTGWSSDSWWKARWTGGPKTTLLLSSVLWQITLSCKITLLDSWFQEIQLRFIPVCLVYAMCDPCICLKQSYFEKKKTDLWTCKHIHSLECNVENANPLRRFNGSSFFIP